MTLARFRELARTLPPDTLAVDDGARAWTYRELDLRAEHLARHLATRGGVAPVALLARPDAPALAALLGALRAGRIIAPIEPRLPLLRQLDAGLALVDDDALAARLRADGWDGDVATIDELERAPAPISATPATTATHARAAATGDDAALVCSTSGPSGRPKGIVFTELSIAAGAAGYRDALALAPGDRLAWLAPLPFGASLTVAFGALLAGATLVPCDAAAGLGALAARLEAQRVTVLHLVPSLFRRLAAALAHEARPLPALRLVKLGGEASFASDLALFARAFPADARLVNGLGLTEACGNVCYASFAADARIDGPRLPVGRAALDTELGLVDGDGRAVADGETGRIVVAGPALAAGYWRDPDGSAAVWRALPGRRGRWLVTADLGRVDADGRLEHLGRADDVVKIRGQAVATGEVEAVVRGLDGVSAAAVVALPHPSAPGESVLAAFVVATRPIERATLARRCPR
ncbi:MAG: AMP-binding protein [Myxococcota bacterium]